MTCLIWRLNGHAGLMAPCMRSCMACKPTSSRCECAIRLDPRHHEELGLPWQLHCSLSAAAARIPICLCDCCTACLPAHRLLGHRGLKLKHWLHPCKVHNVLYRLSRHFAQCNGSLSSQNGQGHVLASLRPVDILTLLTIAIFKSSSVILPAVSNLC